MRGDAESGITIDLYVVVEYGLNLAEVAATVRSRVAYEVERHHGPARARARGPHRGRAGGRSVNDESPLDGARSLARFALAAIEQSRQRIDDLNVYPVPDGDTGTNLTLTVRAVVEQLESSTAADRAAVAHELTRAALMGARGNSGVIFSQIVRGAAEVLGGAEPADVLDLQARAPRRERRRLSRGAPAGRGDDAHRDPRDGRGGRGERRAGSVAELMHAVVRRGEDALARTPELLDVLREAGVVDAGGAGLLEIVRGITAGLAGEPLPEALPREELGFDAVHQELSRYRYCTVFVVEGDELDADALESELEQLGDSLLVVGDRSALKVHVHTDEPGAALSLGTAAGTIAQVEIANMHEQTVAARGAAQRAPPAPTTPALTDVVAVVAGEGNRRLFASLGATWIIEGGQTMNPATAELHDGDRRGARARGDRAAEQRQRDPLGRAGGVARDEARARDPRRLDPGGPRRDGGLRPERVG